MQLHDNPPACQQFHSESLAHTGGGRVLVLRDLLKHSSKPLPLGSHLPVSAKPTCV